MQHKIYSTARRRIIEIWHYTDNTWGEKQADEYIRGLYQAIDNTARKKYRRLFGDLTRLLRF